MARVQNGVDRWPAEPCARTLPTDRQTDRRQTELRQQIPDRNVVMFGQKFEFFETQFISFRMQRVNLPFRDCFNTYLLNFFFSRLL